MRYFVYYLLAINVLGCLVTIVDKRAARRHRWRVPERRLFLLCFLGGCPAVYLTMRLIRHKTKHLRFMLGIPLIFLAQLALLLMIWYFILK